MPEPKYGLASVDSNGTVHVHPTLRAEPAEWAWALAHCFLHLGFGHVPAARTESGREREQPDRHDLAARCVVVNRFLLTFPVGRAPDHLPAGYPGGDEEQIAARWRRDGIPAAYDRCGTAGGAPDQLLTAWHRWNDPPPDWQLAFAHALTRTVSAAMDVAGGRRDSQSGERIRQQPWDRALSWFVSSYPLLGGIAAGMTLVADAELARAHGISVAAVNAAAGEIYVNPLRRYADEEWRFILGHEMLHAALRHGERCGARDPFLFNVAADYVPRPQPVRSYARPARRQAATPDIPRAGRYFPPEEIARCTFGVVLDTSGSMEPALLGKALGAIASYAEARDVPAARVVFCDAAPYDAGYLPPTEIAGKVRVRGRGGTVLQPGIDLLQRADDFPPTAPLLVITDGACDVLRVRREHAFLVPQGAALPFTARGPVFRVT